MSAPSGRDDVGSDAAHVADASRSVTAVAGVGAPHVSRSFLSRCVFSTDHKVIGLQYLFAAAAMMVLGGLMALAIRWQLAWPWTEMPVVGRVLFPTTGRVISAPFYAVLFTMHGTIMIFFVIIPLLLGAFANYLVPLWIGARDMAFPRINAWSFWTMLPAIACLVVGFFVEGGAASAGWTGYAPLSTVASASAGSTNGQTWWLVSLTFSGVSSLLGAINLVTTIALCRAPGMTWMRLPLSVWGIFTSAALQIVALPVLTAGGVLQLSDRLLHTGFFTPANLLIGNASPDALGSTGGSPLLWQHLFWFYSHPAVYVMVLPAMGLVSDVLAVHARRPVFGYRPMVIAMSAICVLGFLVWGHHMFVSGMSPTAGTAFMLSTFLIALPSSIKTFNWLATLWNARVRLTSAMSFALGFVASFVVGGLSGLWMAATPVDVYVHDTYVVVAHFHYVVFGGTVFAVFAGVYHWFPKVTGKQLDERLGRAHFVGTFVLTNCVFLMMHQLGLAGMPRRMADPNAYEFLAHLKPVNVFVTWSAIALVSWQSLFLVNVAWTLVSRRRARENPWDAATLEWETTSPPAHEGFDRPITVERGPYEYGSGGAGPEGPRDWRPQARERSSDPLSSLPRT